MNGPSHDKQIGFTLIELMVTVSLLAILAGLATPSFREMVASQRLRTAAFGLVSDLTLARSEAVKRGASVSLTPVSDAWAGGWRVRLVGGADVLSEQKPVGQGVVFSTAATEVVFDRNGRSTAANTVRFQLAATGSKYRCISIDPSGRPKSVAVECPA